VYEGENILIRLERVMAFIPGRDGGKDGKSQKKK